MAARFLLPVTLFCAASLQAGIDEAKAWVERGDSRRALPVLEAHATSHPGDAQAHFWLGRARLGAAEPKLAEASFKEAIRLDPAFAEAHAWLGNSYGNQASKAGMLSAMGLASRMRKAWDEALRLDPGNLAARTGYLQFYLAAPAIAGGSAEKAREQLPFIREKDRYLANLLESQIARKEGDAAAVERLLGENLARMPARREAWTILADHLVNEKRPAEAFNLLEKWAQQPEAAQTARFFLGRLSATSGTRLDEGERHLRDYIAAPSQADDAPPVAAAHARLGQILAHKGDKQAAREAFQAALAIDPELRTAQDGLKALGKG